jgi:hypothetical protein
MASMTRIVSSTCASKSPTCALAPPGSMLAVPETRMRRSPGNASSTARLKELPYAGAGHWSGEASAWIAPAPTEGRTASRPVWSAVPRGFVVPMPVLAGTRRSNTPRSVKNAVRTALNSRYQPRMSRL